LWRAARELSRPARPVEVSAFDREHGVDTSGTIRLAGLDIAGGNFAHGVYYKASEPEEFRAVMRRLAMGLDGLSGYHFIDMGSGKGLVLLLAAEYGFRRVTGVEFARELHETAVKNIAKKGLAESVESVHGDAAAYAIPEGPLVLYFYEPFAYPVIEQVFANLEASFKGMPRRMVVLYHNAPASSVLSREGELRRELIQSRAWLEERPEWGDAKHSVYCAVGC
jgi:SAM-dependent methyltransferase